MSEAEVFSSSPRNLKFWMEGTLLIWGVVFSWQKEKASEWVKTHKGHQASTAHIL